MGFGSLLHGKMKGTGFSPYIGKRKIYRALAPEERLSCGFVLDFP
jgi:hypothetical protein